MVSKSLLHCFATRKPQPVDGVIQDNPKWWIPDALYPLWNSVYYSIGQQGTAVEEEISLILEGSRYERWRDQDYTD